MHGLIFDLWVLLISITCISWKSKTWKRLRFLLRIRLGWYFIDDYLLNPKSNDQDPQWLSYANFQSSWHGWNLPKPWFFSFFLPLLFLILLSFWFPFDLSLLWLLCGWASFCFLEPMYYILFLMKFMHHYPKKRKEESLREESCVFGLRMLCQTIFDHGTMELLV